MDKIAKTIAEELNIKEIQVEKTLELIKEGNTIPFIARYRKEVTGNLSDEILRNLDERLKYLEGLEERKNAVISLIEGQGKLTEELTKKLEEAKTLSEIEDIYRPYKQKKKTRGTVAKAKGLEPLSVIIYKQEDKRELFEIAKEFLNEEVLTEEDAINGAKDIIAEQISDNAEIRKVIKKFYIREGIIITKALKDEHSSYDMYYEYSEKINRIPSHRILAINRGEKEEFLKVKIEKPEEKILNTLYKMIVSNPMYKNVLEETINDSYSRLIEPSLDREIRAEITEKADKQAIEVFGKNAKQLLLGAPLKGLTVLGFDPAYRTGCKLAVIDETGKVLDTGVIYPVEPQNDIEGAEKELIRLIVKDDINMIAIGNGTASRESEAFVSDVIKKVKETLKKDVYYSIVSEAGASVYSASKLATEEYPDLNVSLRGAISTPP